MSMFNADQRDYMAYLASRPPETKCYCGWWDLGKCRDCPPGLTAADKVARWCPECHNSPPATDLDRPITHNYKCSRGTPKP